jgi:hypothetical protein
MQTEEKIEWGGPMRNVKNNEKKGEPLGRIWSGTMINDNQ